MIKSQASLLLVGVSLSSSVLGLLGLVSLLVVGSLGLVGLLLLNRESSPSLTEDTTNLTKGNTGVLGSDGLTVLASEKHVSREGTLGSVGV